MRGFITVVAVLSQLLIMSGCATAWQSSTYTDDLYSVHNKIAIANRQKAEAELAKAQYEAQQAQYEATLARIKAEAAQQGVTVTEGTIDGYDAVLADTYESAYARRLYGFSSPTYRMPSSYYTWRYSDAFFYASAYDPAFYNVMVSGDMVWVEPKYITSMFGSWGAVAVPSYGWYYGWDYSHYYWNSPYGWSMSWYWGSPYYWNTPYYWGGGYPYYHYHHHHHYPHRPSYHRPPQHHRPPYVGSGSVGNTGHHHNQPGMVVGRNPGASRPANSGSSSVRPSQPSQPSSGRVTTPSYRGGSSSSSSSSSGSSSYRGGSNSGSSSYRGSSSSYNSGGSSYSGGSRGGSSSYGGGSSHGGGGSYSGGGNSRGR